MNSSKGDEFDPLTFKYTFNMIVYSILVAVTKDRGNNKRFHSFFKNIVNNNIII